jgi:hypothetical protein
MSVMWPHLGNPRTTHSVVRESPYGDRLSTLRAGGRSSCRTQTSRRGTPVIARAMAVSAMLPLEPIPAHQHPSSGRPQLAVRNQYRKPGRRTMSAKSPHGIPEAAAPTALRTIAPTPLPRVGAGADRAVFTHSSTHNRRGEVARPPSSGGPLSVSTGKAISAALVCSVPPNEL